MKVKFLIILILFLSLISHFFSVNASSIEIWTDRDEYCLGDPLIIYYRSSDECNISIILHPVGETFGKMIEIKHINGNELYTLKWKAYEPASEQELKIDSNLGDIAYCRFLVIDCSQPPTTTPVPTTTPPPTTTPSPTTSPPTTRPATTSPPITTTPPTTSPYTPPSSQSGSFVYIGVFAGIIVLLLVIYQMTRKKPEKIKEKWIEKKEPKKEVIVEKPSKHCPFCGKLISLDVTICPYCKKDLEITPELKELLEEERDWKEKLEQLKAKKDKLEEKVYEEEYNEIMDKLVDIKDKIIQEKMKGGKKK